MPTPSRDSESGGCEASGAPTALPIVVREAARRFGQRTAYVAPEGWELSYAALDAISDEVAAGLARRGLTDGSVVGVCLPAGIEYLTTYVAAAKLGAVTAGVNDRLAGPERAAMLERVDPALVLAEAGTDGIDGHDVVECGRAGLPADVLPGLRDAGRDAPWCPTPDDPDRPVAIIFTSGTTGVPKGALYGHRQIDFITRTDVGDSWDVGGRGVIGTSFAHLGFTTKLVGSLRRGGTTILMRRWSARTALEAIARERITTVAGVPTQLALMLRDPDFDAFDLTCVAAVLAGGGPITPATATEARDRFGAPLATRYSCTEAGIGLGTAFTDPEEDAVVSVGRPLPGVELALRDPETLGAAAVPSGAVGEVCLRSPACMTGYWRDPVATREAFTPDGYVRTGDLGWVDDAGRLRLVGRAKEMYVRGGYNVYPVEVEAVLSRHAALAQVAVVSTPDTVMGERGVACVVLRSDRAAPTLADLRDFARPDLAAYKLPDALHVFPALPLTAGDKVDRPALRAEVARRST